MLNLRRKAIYIYKEGEVIKRSLPYLKKTEKAVRVSKIRPIELIVLIALTNSCSGVSFDPDYALPNVEHQVLVHAPDSDGNIRTVDFNSNEMLSYACMHETKVRELADLLSRSEEFSNHSETLTDIQRAIKENK